MADLLSALRDRQDDLARSALANPKRDLFDHALQAGEFMGIQFAIDTFLNLKEPRPAPKQEKSAVYS